MISQGISIIRPKLNRIKEQPNGVDLTMLQVLRSGRVDEESVMFDGREGAQANADTVLPTLSDHGFQVGFV